MSLILNQYPPFLFYLQFQFENSGFGEKLELFILDLVELRCTKYQKIHQSSKID